MLRLTSLTYLVVDWFAMSEPKFTFACFTSKSSTFTGQPSPLIWTSARKRPLISKANVSSYWRFSFGRKEIGISWNSPGARTVGEDLTSRYGVLSKTRSQLMSMMSLFTTRSEA